MGYRGKLAEKEAARALRADGLTLLEIAGRLGVSKSSVSLWTRDIPFTPQLPLGRLDGSVARRREPNALQRRKADEIERLRLEGIERVGTLSERDVLIAGAALYAGEGGKRDGAVTFSNSDPGMIALFMRWLRGRFEIEERRLRVRLYLHTGLDVDDAVAFWSGVTAIPTAQFTKPYRAPADGGIRHSKHLHGCATVVYNCSRTHREIMGICAAVLGAKSDPG